MPGESFLLKPLFPFLLSLFFVLHGFTENFLLISIKDTLTILLIYQSSTIGLIFLFRLYFKNTLKAALFSFLLMGFNFFFGYLYDMIKSFLAGFYFPGSFLVKYAVILLVALLAFAVTAIILKKGKPISKKLLLFLNLLLIIFIFIDLAVVIKKSVFHSSYKESKLTNENDLTCGKRNLPDVYFIIADEYAGNKALTDIFGFDNSSFINSLRQKGFFVANNSKSNYAFTTYSMASLLNMDYLDLKKSQVKKIDNLFTLKLICDNKICTFFKKAGYGFYNYSVFDINGQFAQNKNSFVPVRTKLFTSQTLVSRLKNDIWLTVVEKLGFQNVVKNNLLINLKFNHQIFGNTIKAIYDSSNVPKFVYTHFELPHFPYYYDQNGNLYPYQIIANTAPEDKIKYIQYLQYTNKELLKLVDEIIQHNQTPPIIILMSDHGFRWLSGETDTYLFSNLISVYLPDKNYGRFNDSISNVNVFRALLNTEFCQQIPMLKDTSIAIGK